MPRKREAAATRKTVTPRRKPATRKSKPKPNRSPQLREAAKQNLARVEELAALYRPLHEAAEAELAKTASGKKLLRETRTLGEELNERHEKIAPRKTSDEEGRRLADQRREAFVHRHQEQLLEAYAPHARLQPPVEAITQLLQPEMASETLWVAETSLHRGMVLRPKPDHEMVLRPKPDPEDLGTIGQGLDDPAPMPGPFQSCLRPDYPWREDYGWAPPIGGALAQAELNGTCVSWGEAIGLYSIPVTAGANAWVGGDFAVPKGLTDYALAVDYYFDFYQFAFALFGVGVSNLDVAILVDKKDGTPMEKYAESVCCLVVPFAGGDNSYHWGNAKVEHLFRRATSDAANVRVLVGADGHGDVWAYSGGAKFSGSVEVRSICLTSIG
jgi:hypothetical protein